MADFWNKRDKQIQMPILGLNGNELALSLFCNRENNMVEMPLNTPDGYKHLSVKCA